MPRKNSPPHIKQWAPLEIAERTLFPGREPQDLTAAERKQALAYAKQLLKERTGYVMEP